ncbi:GATA transcription factor [Rhynchospora pubera]|uniref:GATA transcription factor n=1 Tax=Rhynchospora pubera TaxID=906938 RepID=A0AAV8C6B1_9POAL|nr:GATA transcription factor [Rhynchospora pubera]
MEFAMEKKGYGNGDAFLVEDLLDFSNEAEEEEALELVSGGNDVAEANFSADTSTVSTAVDSCNSSFSGEEARHGFVGAGAGLSGDLCEPQLDVLAELEWMSNLVEEESFSSEDLEKLQLISPSGIKANMLSAFPPIKTEVITNEIKTDPAVPNGTIPSPSSSFTNRHSAAATPHPGLLVPLLCKARSKRSRSLGPTSWSSSHILGLCPAGPTDSNSANPILVKKPAKQPKKREMPTTYQLAPPSAGRRCLHCETDKTPQWRTGPMGPKTLCNACGVRYKSGRLVPEYRPAASPTFVVSKHSNSHRKVVELRRQKEMHMQHLQQQQLLLHGATPVHAPNGDDFLIHHQIGPDFRQLI